MAMDTVPRVAVRTAEPAPVRRTRTVLGVTEARRDAFLTPLRGGRVARLPGAVGEAVSEGDALVVLEASEAEANLALARAGVAEAEAVLADARQQLHRVQALGDGASPAQVDQARLGVARAEAVLDRARAQARLASVNLAWMTVSAPFDGVLTSRSPELGEAVGTAAPVARVVDVSAARVEVGLVEDEVVGAAAPEARFTVSAQGTDREATVVHLAEAADPRSLSWPLTLEVADPPWPVGTPVSVALELPAPAADARVPAVAVDGGTVAVVGPEDVLARVPVSVVDETPEGLLVRGLEAGSAVVVHGAHGLVDGETVRPVAEDP